MKTQSYVLGIEDLINLNLHKFLDPKDNNKNIKLYEYISKNISSFAQKVKNIENLVNIFTFQIIVNDANKQPNDLLDKDILYIENIEKLILLQAIYENKLQKHILEDKSFLITLVSFDYKFNSEDYYIVDYILKFSKYVKDSKIDFSYVNTNKKYSDYIKGAKKSLFKTVFGCEEKKRIRGKRLEINCFCGTKHNLKEEEIKQYFFKKGEKLFFRCTQEHKIEFESKDFIFTTNYKQEEYDGTKLIIVPKYFKVKIKEFDFAKWMSKNLRGLL